MAHPGHTGDRVAKPESLPPLELRRLRDLDLRDRPDDGVPAHVASASGVVRRGDFVYVIGDDLVQVAIFEISAGEPGRALKVLPGDLPADRELRAERKPDLEALTALPPVEGVPHGALLGIGSGSNPSRDRGFFCSFAADGSLDEDPREIDMHPVYEALRDEMGGQVTSRGRPCSATACGCFIAATRDAGEMRSPSSSSRTCREASPGSRSAGVQVTHAAELTSATASRRSVVFPYPAPAVISSEPMPSDSRTRPARPGRGMMRVPAAVCRRSGIERLSHRSPPGAIPPRPRAHRHEQAKVTSVQPALEIYSAPPCPWVPI